MKNVVSKEWLLKNLNDEKVRIIDCRFSLAQPEKGGEEYKKSHLPNAVFFDLEKDLSGEKDVHGGRHPLPNLAELTSKLESAGINEHITVVAYDHGEGSYAARFWWLLQYLGHKDVYVLDGGFKGWMESNYPVDSSVPSFTKIKFSTVIQSETLVSIEDVKEFVRNRPNKAVLIDSREEKRYLGIEEPIDKKAGHIPGAVNKPWMEGLTGGCFKPVEEQIERFKDITLDKDIIVYCGSGVTAVPNYIALKEAGYKNVKLYVGSFSDWISYEENEIE
jgi:thiosulfate/3-mercaptopyruvate sulfurtransferase